MPEMSPQDQGEKLTHTSEVGAGFVYAYTGFLFDGNYLSLLRSQERRPTGKHGVKPQIHPAPVETSTGLRDRARNREKKTSLFPFKKRKFTSSRSLQRFHEAIPVACGEVQGLPVRRGRDRPGPDTAGSSRFQPPHLRAQPSPSSWLVAPQGKRILKGEKTLIRLEGSSERLRKALGCVPRRAAGNPW